MLAIYIILCTALLLCSLLQCCNSLYSILWAILYYTEVHRLTCIYVGFVANFWFSFCDFFDFLMGSDCFAVSFLCICIFIQLHIYVYFCWRSGIEGSLSLPWAVIWWIKRMTFCGQCTLVDLRPAISIQYFGAVWQLKLHAAYRNLLWLS